MKFSVLISVYFKEKPEYLSLALDSIWDSQTIKPNEIVIVKDGLLTNDLDAIIDSFALKAPVNIVTLEKNVGLGLALAKGIGECSNDIIARMDSDDISKADRFEKQLNKINEGYDLVSCWSAFFEDSIDNIIAIKKRPEHHKDILKLAKRRSPVGHAMSMYKKKSVLDAGNYRDVGFSYEDYNLWVRMLHNDAKFYNIQEPLYYVRSSKEQIGRRGGFGYMVKEIVQFWFFYRLGFYSFYNFMENTLTHSIIRIIPTALRKLFYKKIWQS
ncbi:glycosyl transferase [Bacteroidia bacterium]|nr:glycosyl transferase [Bacteroidia bacterium]